MYCSLKTLWFPPLSQRVTKITYHFHEKLPYCVLPKKPCSNLNLWVLTYYHQFSRKHLLRSLFSLYPFFLKHHIILLHYLATGEAFVCYRYLKKGDPSLVSNCRPIFYVYARQDNGINGEG